MLLSSEQLLWACTHHLMLEVLVWMLCPGGNAGTDSGLEQLCSTPHCIYIATAWAWKIHVSPCASAWLNCPSCRNLGSAAPPSRSAVSAGACRCYHNTNNNQSLTDTSEALTETKHNKKASPGAESAGLCKRFFSESGRTPISWDI